ncbi:MAG: rRNA pseudouridine synthase [Actinobacteria bacterium]|nr:rRNA pseudouridine synthase [Actinomycetota bacterium]
MGLTRLNKIIADAGIASRRAADQLILDGRVTVDDRIIIELGRRFDPQINKIQVDGETLISKKSITYIAFHKPIGVISTMSDPEGRANLGDYFKERSDRLFHVGRLDKDSEGLILLTNDGDLAHRATHPSYGLEKRYLVEIEGEYNKATSDQLLQGVRLEDGLARALNVVLVRSVSKNHHWVEITIHEGRYHIIRRLIEALGMKVIRLIRIDFGPINLGDLKVGRHRVLNEPEVIKLFNLLNINR